MITKGDRIIENRGDGGPNVSGIVAHSVDLGHGDFMVAVWDGCHHGGEAFEMRCVSIFEVEVLERDCKVVDLPAEAVLRLDAITAQAKADTDPAFEQKLNEAAAVVRRGMRELSTITAQMIRRLREADADLSSARTRATLNGVMVEWIKRFVGKSAPIIFMQAVLLVVNESLTEAMGVAASDAEAEGRGE